MKACQQLQLMFCCREYQPTSRQKDMFFAQCINKIHTSVPKEDSEEDIRLKSCEFKIGPGEDGYSMAAIHVYYQNQYCDEWNERMLDMLPGEKFTSAAQDSRKDNHTRLVDADMPPEPQDTSGLRKILNVKVGGRIMVTTNIDVSDGLINGATGTISDIVMNETSTKIKKKSCFLIMTQLTKKLDVKASINT